MRILIADDDPSFRLMLKSYLKDQNHDILEADTGTSTLSYLQAENPPELVFMDWKMPGYTGLELTEFIRTEQPELTPYVIMVSGNDSEEHILHALSNGADDYIVKPIDARFIQAKVTVANRFIETQKKLQKTNNLLSKLGLVDEITGLVNVHAATQLLISAIQQVKNDNTSLTVANIAIDDLQGIKNRFGKSAYESVIKQVADSAQTVIDVSDMCCRNQDGLLIVSEVTGLEAETLFKQVETAITSCVCEFDNQPVHCRLTTVEITADSVSTVDQVLKQLRA
jgi:diguanylate cyclase (GGDEF)-like protein